MGYKKIIDYKIVEGLPNMVEKEVKLLLKENWQPYSKLYKMKLQCSNIEIVIQCMVLYGTI